MGMFVCVCVNWSLQQESPSAEMVMLERLFLQAERYALAEDRRRVRRDPGQCRCKLNKRAVQRLSGQNRYLESREKTFTYVYFIKKKLFSYKHIKCNTFFINLPM